MDIVLRNEKESDYEIVEDLTREAFWNLHAPGCDEHYLVHTLRHRSEFVPELDYVVVIDDKVVGNIMYVKTTIISSDNKNLYDVITFGPLSVLPKYQKMGIGRKLIEFTKIKAAKMGFNAILIYGDPLYYSRFGFENAQKHNIKNANGLYAAALQAYELYPNSLASISGYFHEGDAYVVDDKLAEEFDKKFSTKEKLITATQARFNKLSNMTSE